MPNEDTDTVSPPGGDEIKAITRNGKPIPVTSRLFALVISIELAEGNAAFMTKAYPDYTFTVEEYPHE